MFIYPLFWLNCRTYVIAIWSTSEQNLFLPEPYTTSEKGGQNQIFWGCKSLLNTLIDSAQKVRYELSFIIKVIHGKHLERTFHLT